MLVETLHIEGLLLIKPQVYADSRGYFMESFNQSKFRECTGLDLDFVQDNESMSAAGVVRGLHFQRPPKAQGKLVRVIKGAVIDIALDIRADSPTFGQHASVVLSESNKHQLYIPEGFAHGFGVLEPDTIFVYKCTDYYDGSSEGCVRWDDPQLAIHWGIDHPIVSEKDRERATPWQQFSSPFRL